LTDPQLAEAQRSDNEWLVRTARLLLHERSAHNAHATDDVRALLASGNPLHVTRGLWTLAACDQIAPHDLANSLHHTEEEVRAVAVRLLADRIDPRATAKDAPAELAPLRELAAHENSARVRLALAAALQRIPVVHRAALGETLLRPDLPVDQNLALALWYGIEGIAERAEGKEQLAAFALRTSVPLLRQFATRRLAEESDLTVLDTLLAQAALPATNLAGAARSDLITGMQQGFRGRARIAKPPHWDPFAALLDPANAAVRALAALFGDGRAIEEIRRTALDNDLDYPTRRAALETLIEMHDGDLRATCEKLVAVRELAPVAARGLARFDDPKIAELLLQRYFNCWEHDRPAIIAALTARPVFAHLLLDSVKAGSLPRNEISVAQARQIRNLKDPQIDTKLSEVWGTISESSEAKRQAIEKWKRALTTDRLRSANAAAGRTIFNRSCATCHRLFGEGTDFGPDLTGSDRRNLSYLLENIVDPNATVPTDARMWIARLKDGRVFTGLPGPANDQSVTLRALGGVKEVIARGDLAGLEQLPQSIMPEGLLEAMDEKSVADLIAYLMSPSQVAGE
jgi:putative heme-binding domain-containing protein